MNKWKRRRTIERIGRGRGRGNEQHNMNMMKKRKRKEGRRWII